MVLRFWQYISSTRLRTRKEEEEEEKEDKEHEKTCFAVYPECYVEINLFLLNLFFWYVFDIDVTRNGNNLKP